MRVVADERPVDRGEQLLIDFSQRTSVEEYRGHYVLRVNDAPLLRWTRSSRCYGHGECVEIADVGDGVTVALRDSKSPETHLVFSRAEIAAFFDGIRHGEFDHLT